MFKDFMKLSFSTFICCLCITTIFSQNSDFGWTDNSVKIVSIDSITEPAEFPGGIVEMRKFVAENIVYPEIAREMDYQGKVYCKLYIDSIGNIIDVKILKDIVDCPECSEECIRVINLMPKWKPAKNKDVEVNSTYMIPISFILTNGKKDRKRNNTKR
jgi:hypothetical protein